MWAPMTDETVQFWSVTRKLRLRKCISARVRVCSGSRKRTTTKAGKGSVQNKVVALLSRTLSLGGLGQVSLLLESRYQKSVLVYYHFRPTLVQLCLPIWVSRLSWSLWAVCVLILILENLENRRQAFETFRELWCGDCLNNCCILWMGWCVAEVVLWVAELFVFQEEEEEVEEVVEPDVDKAKEEL